MATRAWANEDERGHADRAANLDSQSLQALWLFLVVTVLPGCNQPKQSAGRQEHDMQCSRRCVPWPLSADACAHPAGSRRSGQAVSAVQQRGALRPRKSTWTNWFILSRSVSEFSAMTAIIRCETGRKVMFSSETLMDAGYAHLQPVGAIARCKRRVADIEAEVVDACKERRFGTNFDGEMTL